MSKSADLYDQTGYTQAGEAGYAKPTELVAEGEPIFDSNNRELNRRFRVSGYRDWFFALLFWAQFIAVLVVGGINLKNGKVDVTVNSTNSDGTKNAVKSIGQVFAQSAGIAVGVALACTVMFLAIMKAAPKGFIWVSNLFVVALFLGYGVLGIQIQDYVLAAFGFIFALITGAWLYCVRHRIEFSAILLETSVKVCTTLYGTIILAFVYLFIGFFYSAFWGMMTVPTMNHMVNDETNAVNNGGMPSSSTAAWVFLGFLLLYFWVCFTVSGVTIVTTAGSAATWYFVGNFDDLPSNPTLASAKRALTTSFGSIALCSLVLAILKTIEVIARAAYRRNGNSIGACVALCVIRCLEAIARYFAKWAYIHISIYGTSLFEASKQTVEFIKNFIWSALINDILVDRCFILAAIFEAALCGIINWQIFKDHSTGLMVIAIIMGVLVGLIVPNIVFSCISAGVDTILVCVAEAPDVLQSQHLELSQRVNAAIANMQKGCCDE